MLGAIQSAILDFLCQVELYSTLFVSLGGCEVQMKHSVESCALCGTCLLSESGEVDIEGQNLALSCFLRKGRPQEPRRAQLTGRLSQP